MLVTDTGWAECHPIRRELAKPYQSWRCVGWTGEVPNFFVIPSTTGRRGDFLPDGFLVSGPEALIEVASQCVATTCVVYVLNRSPNDVGMRLDRVTDIWREQEAEGDGGPWLWYTTGRGEVRPCSSIRQHLGEQRELLNVASFSARAPA
jgi:hypothetical protein